MSNHTVATTAPNIIAGMFNWLGRWLLIVPEAAVLLALLVVYPALGAPLLIALVATVLVTTFTVRTLALQLCKVMVANRRYRDARALLWVAYTLYPYSADAQALQGTLALAEGAPEQAEQALCKAIRLLPTQPSFHSALSCVLIELGRPVEAARAAKQALALAPNHAQAYLYLAEAEQASGAASGEVEKHLRIGLKVAKQPEEQAALQYSLVTYLLDEHRFAEATLVIHGIETTLRGCPELYQAELRSMLGELCLTPGQTGHARFPLPLF